MTVKGWFSAGRTLCALFLLHECKKIRKVFGWQEYNCRVPWGTTSAHSTVRPSITLTPNYKLCLTYRLVRVII